MDCHTQRTETGAYNLQGYMAGGVPFTGPWGTSYSANLTPTGIGSWTDAQIIRAIQQGVAPDGHRLAPAMPYQAYAQLSPEDLRAIIAYLRTLTPRPNPPAQPANDTTPGGPMPRGMALPPPTVDTSTGAAAGALVIVGPPCTRRDRPLPGILRHRRSPRAA